MKHIRSSLSLAYLVLMTLLLLHPGAALRAQVPQQINYQGTLSLAGGVQAPDSTYTVRFALYNNTVGGTALWEERREIALRGGVFDVILGERTPLDLPFDRAYWLGLTVEPESEMSPRIALTAVPYSYRTRAVEDGSVTGASIADDAVQSRHIADEAAESRHIAGGAVQSRHIADEAAESRHIAGGAVLDRHISDGAVQPRHIESSAVLDRHIADGQIVRSVNGLRDDVVLAGRGATSVRISRDTLFIESASGESGIQRLESPDSSLAISSSEGPVAALTLAPDAAVRSLNGTTGTLRLTGEGRAAILQRQDTLVVSVPEILPDRGWRLGGNSGTVDTVDWLGTPDSTAFEIRVNGRRSFRIEPRGARFGPNILMGSIQNRIDSGAHSVTISGGGMDQDPILGNHAKGNYATIGGGRSNVADTFATIAGGAMNRAEERGGSIGGGAGNRTGYFSTVSGGLINQAPGRGAFVGGGSYNIANGYYSAVLGGGSSLENPDQSHRNRTDGDWSVILGGQGNMTGGKFSLASGRNAKATHPGSFVWSDTTGRYFASTGDNQFSAKATGGFRLITAADEFGSNAVGALLRPGESSWASVSDARLKERFAAVDGEGVLRKLEIMPAGSWQYRGRKQDVRHYGPTAQDFFAAFGDDGIGTVGSDTTITASDVDGIALIAIKALIQRTRQLESRQEQLLEEIAALRKQLISLQGEEGK